MTDVEKRRIDKFGPGWYVKLKDALANPRVIRVSRYVGSRREQTNVYPPPNIVFRAFKLCPYEITKVVIIGQDPYHDGSADGLAFSANTNSRTPVSLRHIQEAVLDLDKEMSPEYRKKVFIDNDLGSWAKQGVLLLNTALTVEAGKPGSHANQGWEFLIRQAMLSLANKDHVVFILWGSHAKSFSDAVVNPKHLILTSEHPAAAAYNNRKWEYNNCFDKANEYLVKHGDEPVDWGSVVVF